MLTGMNHLTLAVSQVQRSMDFYALVLGFAPRAQWARGAYLSLGDLWLCLSLDKPEISSDYTHYAFTLEPGKMAEFRARLGAFGIVEWKQNRSEGDSVYFLDPDGHKLEAHCGGLSSRLAACREAPWEGMVFYPHGE
ncbi:VOC family protein [Mangrovibacter plantisponsor]|uniref:Catechol 2,3-dioxygenase-like lactoylglutathione lyase family enzyme n=1 Tax=Mangrovibacter plantisponsor TaxID=451513 RepID=A0A317Q0R7_9ENTR|nr:VOC family protein [Mangrovibacter plantisponsor]PWW09116.1 catechol 2,3-dioxygenase-like lactoylglutathione lyase family enzyme [Mangrovibacter plantisponsor]